MPIWEKPPVGLTGGWDTRAVVSFLRALGADFSARVGSLPGHPDVLIASELAKIAGFDLAVRHAADLPPDNADACRGCIFSARRGSGCTKYSSRSGSGVDTSPC